MTDTPRPPVEPAIAAGHPYRAEIEAEQVGWYELVGLVRRLTPDECLEPGYYREPEWTVRDLVGHVGTWLAEAATQLARMAGGTYAGHDIDIEALNAAFLEAMRDQPWEVAWVQARASRSQMLAEWYGLRTRDDEAAWWVRKCAADHYAEHLDRLREWVEELAARRRGRQPHAGAGSIVARPT